MPVDVWKKGIYSPYTLEKMRRQCAGTIIRNSALKNKPLFGYRLGRPVRQDAQLVRLPHGSGLPLSFQDSQCRATEV